MLEILTPDRAIKYRQTNKLYKKERGKKRKKYFVPTQFKTFNNFEIYAKLDAKLV